MSAQHDFERFMKQREEAASAYVRGDAKPLGGVTAHAGPATFFGPQGGYRESADEVWSDYERGASMFEPGGESRLEVLQMAADGDIAYWAGIQKATVRLRGKLEPVPMDLRVTETFRRENGEWKLVHRHADMLAAEAAKK